jgi:hypothetical protein
MIRRIMDGRCIGRDDAGALGAVAAVCEGTDALRSRKSGLPPQPGLFLDGLLSEERRKTGCIRA